MAGSIFLPLGFRKNLENSVLGLQLKEIRELALSGGDTQYLLSSTELYFWLSFLLKPFLNCILPSSLLKREFRCFIVEEASLFKPNIGNSQMREALALDLKSWLVQITQLPFQHYSLSSGNKYWGCGWRWVGAAWREACY